jgi:predicted nucleotide-binding protein
MEKLLDHAQEASYAVVLLTPDDRGGRINCDVKDLLPRARENVIFEFGLFVGLLGREKVAALRVSGVSEPSDIRGVVYIEMDDHGAWRQQLAKELRAAGIPVNLQGLV